MRNLGSLGEVSREEKIRNRAELKDEFRRNQGEGIREKGSRHVASLASRSLRKVEAAPGRARPKKSAYASRRANCVLAVDT